VTLDDLPGLGVSERSRAALVALLADLPHIPVAGDSALLIGTPETTLACLAVLARHIGQALRDHNAALLHDRARLRAERLKLGFLSQRELTDEAAVLERALREEAALFVQGLSYPLPPELTSILDVRCARGLASFASSALAPPEGVLSGWRRVSL
jgi:hypothetical protein